MNNLEDDFYTKNKENSNPEISNSTYPKDDTYIGIKGVPVNDFLVMFKLKNDKSKRYDIISSLIQTIQYMQEMIKSLDPDTEDILDVENIEVHVNEDEYLDYLYSVVLQLQLNLANLYNKMSSALEANTELIEELYKSSHR